MRISRVSAVVATASLFASSVSFASADLPLRLNDSVVTAADGVRIVAAHTPECDSPGAGQEWLVEQSLIASNADLGGDSVFGIALKTNAASGEADIYVAASSAYSGDDDADGFDDSADASGKIYKIDGVSGAVSVFADVGAPHGGGIGNLAYNDVHDVFYATSVDAGTIVTIGADGTVLGSLDPFAPAGFSHPNSIAPVTTAGQGERLLGVGYNANRNRVYAFRQLSDQSRISKSGWSQIYSFCVDDGGVVVRCDFPNPPWTKEVSVAHMDGTAFSSPGYDIEFDASADRMLVAERSMSGDWDVSSGASRVIEYVWDASTNWWMDNPNAVPPAGASGSSFGIGSTGRYASGGASYDAAQADACNLGGHVVATADSLFSTGGVQLAPASGGDLNNSYAAAVDGSLGDVDACTSCPPHPEVCGDGLDNDNNGVADCDDAECADELDCQPDPNVGCTYTQGYWKNHYAGARGKRDIPWPISEDTDLCGDTWLSNLRTQPRGDAFYILSHQYIAAELNIADGAGYPQEVADARASAEAIFADCVVDDAERAQAIADSQVLDDFNNGFIGPGHCSEGRHVANSGNSLDRPDAPAASADSGPDMGAGCSATGSERTAAGSAMAMLLVLMGLRRRRTA